MGFNKKQLFLQWTIATSIGLLLAFAVPFIVSTQFSIFAKRYFKDLLIPSAVIVTVIAGAAGGAILGFFQSLVLKRFIKNFSIKNYVLATAIAIALIFLVISNPKPINPEKVNRLLFIFAVITFSSVFFLSIGIAQWIVLKRYLKKAGWWIVANAIALPVSGLVGAFAISLTQFRLATPLYIRIIIGILIGSLNGAIYGAITGFVLINLLKQEEKALE